MKNKSENLVQRAYLNSVTTILDYITKVIVGLVITPIIINGLGVLIFGVWQVISQLTSYTRVVDIKVTQVLKWTIARNRDQSDYDELRSYVTSSFILLLCITPIILSIGGLLTLYAPILTKVDYEYYLLVRITTALLIFGLIISNIASLFESILRGMNLGYKRIGVRSILYIIGGFGSATVIWLEMGIIGLAIVEILITVSFCLLLYSIIKSNVEWFGFGKFNLKKTKEFLSLSTWFVSWSVVKLVLLSSDKVLLGSLAGPVVVTKYVITLYIIKTFQGLIENIVHGVIPGVGKLYGNQKLDQFWTSRNQTMIITWLISIFVGMNILLFNKTFVYYWIGSDQFAGDMENFFILLVAFQYVFINNDGVFINATLDLKQKVYMGLIASVFTIILAFLLIPTYSIIGLSISLLIGRLTMSFTYPFIIAKKIGSKYKSHDILVRPFILTVLFFYIFYKIGESLPESTQISSIIFLIIITISTMPVIYYLGVKKSDRIELIKLLKKVKLFSKKNA